MSKQESMEATAKLVGSKARTTVNDTIETAKTVKAVTSKKIEDAKPVIADAKVKGVILAKVAKGKAVQVAGNIGANAKIGVMNVRAIGAALLDGWKNPEGYVQVQESVQTELDIADES